MDLKAVEGSREGSEGVKERQWTHKLNGQQPTEDDTGAVAWQRAVSKGRLNDSPPRISGREGRHAVLLLLPPPRRPALLPPIESISAAPPAPRRHLCALRHQRDGQP